MLIRFWCISLKKFYSKFWISLAQQYRAKLHAIVLNVDYFRSIILKFKTFIYNSSSKIIDNFCMCGSNTVSLGDIDGWDGFNIGLPMQWTSADGLGFTPKDGPKTVSQFRSLDKWRIHHFAKRCSQRFYL